MKAGAAGLPCSTEVPRRRPDEDERRSDGDRAWSLRRVVPICLLAGLLSWLALMALAAWFMMGA